MNPIIQNLVVVTPPTTEAITLAQAKLHCRVEIADDDDLITDLIPTARMMVETMTRRCVNQTTFELKLGGSGLPWAWGYDSGFYGSSAWYYDNVDSCDGDQRRIYLPKPPLVQVHTVSTVDDAGNLSVIDPSLYTVDAGGDLAGSVNLAYASYGVGGLVINYSAGYAVDAIPSPIRTAIKLIVGHLYRNREATTEAGMEALPMGIKAVLAPLVWGGGYR